MLARHRDGTGNRQRQRASHADGVVQNLVNAAQVGAPEGRQAMREKLVEGGAFIHAADVDVMAVFGGHKSDGSRKIGLERKGAVSEQRSDVGAPDTPAAQLRRRKE